MKVRTRFAPSPTGFLHIGGLRTALYNYLFSKQHDGEFILRIEDTDQKRLIQNSQEQLLTILNQFKINFDEGPSYNEKFGPYLQSERLDIYKKYYSQLLEENNAYLCFEDNKGNLIPEKDYNHARTKMLNSKFVIKMCIPKEKNIIIKDDIRGDIDFDLSLIEDPIIIKSDGFPTYHFANVIDDYLMKITHVIRGDEWLPSLPKHIILYNHLNWKPPTFIHLPLLLNPDKSKLSKRQGDVHVEDFVNKGFLKEAIINYVALLGWHPNSNDEIFSLNELIQTFSINRVQKAGAIFDIKKLNWMNSYYFKKMDDNKFQKILLEFCKKNKIKLKLSNNQLSHFIKYTKNRIQALYEIKEQYALFANTPIFNQESAIILSTENSKTIIAYWANNLNKSDESSITKMIKTCGEKYNIKGKELFFPLRISLIGQTNGPDLYTIINILGIQESLKRIINGKIK